MRKILKVLKVINISGRCLLQHKLRSVLSILGVVCGVMAFLSMISIGEGAKQAVVRQIEQLGVRNIYIKAVQLTPEERLRATERLSPGLSPGDAIRVANGCPYVSNSAYLKEVTAAIIGMTPEISPQIVAVSPGYGDIQQVAIQQGRFIAAMDATRRNLVCVIGARVADRLGAGGRPGDHLRIGDHLFTIVGILNRFEPEKQQTATVAARDHNEMIFIPYGTHTAIKDQTRKAVSDAATGLTEIVVQVRNPGRVLSAAQIIARTMQVSHHGVGDYQLVVPQELLMQARNTQRTFNLVLGAIAAVALLVGGIGIMNIMLATVSERTREIGIRRAVGATRTDIVLQFLIEALILTVTGGGLGIGFGIAAVWIVSKIGDWAVAVTPLAVALPLGMAILVGIFFGLYPALKAAAMDPVSAFRHE